MASEAAAGVQERRVLCAFRKPKLRQRLEELLREGGFATTPAGSAVELLDGIARDRPDVVLLDGALGGGGTLSLRVDAQGKTLGAALLRMEIDVSPDEL